VDVPGKDSHTHRLAGATEVFVCSDRRWAQIHELRNEDEPSLNDILARLSPVDLVVVEGYKRHPHPKLEIHRAEVGKPLLHPGDDWIVAVASDGSVPDARVPVLDLADAEKIADVLMVESVPIERLGEETERV
jgi:molybdopterin-guanine dinucleotide biosynthesis protein B